jgi:hypothetical protein
MLDVEQDFLLFAIILDQSVQRVRVGHPANQPRVGRERDDCKALDSQVAAEGLRVVKKEGVDKAEKLHDPLVLPQVLVALEQKHVLAPVAAHRRQLPRALLGRYDLQRRFHLGNLNHLGVRDVAPRNGQLEVATQQHLGRNVLQFQLGQLRQLELICHFQSSVC